MTELIRRTDAATLTMTDGLVAFWRVLWSVIGAWVGFLLWERRPSAAPCRSPGAPLDSVGQAPQRAGDLPLIGAWPAEPEDQVRATAAEIIARGEQSAAYGRQVSLAGDHGGGGTGPSGSPSRTCRRGWAADVT